MTKTNQPVNRPDKWEYICEVTRVVDGDTIEVCIRSDMGFRVVNETVQRIRLARIDAPERYRGTEEGRAAGKAATEWLKDMIEGKTVIIRTDKVKETFNRYVAEVWFDDENISDVLVDAGHAKYENY